MYTLEELKAMVENAIQRFNASEGYLIENDLNERCICARFAMYLEAEIRSADLDGYCVDVEYNRGRNGRNNMSKMMGYHNIAVDLIVHQRGYDQQYGFRNLICIEMKKERRRRDVEADRDRLCKLTDECYGFCYRAGFMLMIHQDKRRDDYYLKIDSAFEHGMECR